MKLPDIDINAIAADARWYGHSEPLVICDALELDGLALPAWLLLARAGEALYFCPVAHDGAAWRDIAATAFYQRDVMGWLQRRASVSTALGGRIEFDSAMAFSCCELLRADAGGSSNTVSQIALGGVTAMHKVYRKLAPQECELDATERVDRIMPGLVPRCLGGYRYRSAGADVHALGLLTEYVQGRGLHQDLSASIRSLWPLAQAGQHCAALLPALRGWRAFIERLHAAMALALPASASAPATFDMAGLCADARARIARIRPQLAHDPLLAPTLLAPTLRARMLRLLDAVEQQVLVPVALQAAPCHGDLHLSHMLWDGRENRRIIDLSPPPSGHPLQDWVAIERALEYFCLDECALELAPHAGMTQEATMQALLVALPANAAIAAMSARMQAMTSWHGAVRGALCGDHLAGPARASTYCARLLQELDYNYSHRRPYYRCIDFYFLAQHFSSLIGE